MCKIRWHKVPALAVVLVFLSGAWDAQALAQQPSKKDSIRKDSIRQKFVADSAHLYRPKKFRPVFNYDNRNSVIQNAPVNFVGFQLGISYKDKHTFGIGGYKITQKSQRPLRTRDADNRVLEQYLTLNYLTLFYQNTLLDKKYIELDFPIELGPGRANLKLIDSAEHVKIKEINRNIITFGSGVQLVVKPVKWVGMSVMGGYRLVSDADRRLNFNGWYYAFGIWLDIRQIYRDTKYYSYLRPRYRRQMAAAGMPK